MTVVSNLPGSDHAEIDEAIVSQIFSSIGRCRFMDEKHFDACTALSGAGPAFACLIIDAMADGGVMMGLPRAEALELAAQSAYSILLWEFQSGSLHEHHSLARCSTDGAPRRHTPCTTEGFGR